MIILNIVIILTLIYIAARHSTYVDYNKDGKMMNLCGRYVAYATPLLAICWIRGGDYIQNRHQRSWRKLFGGILGVTIVWVAYEYLYVFSPGVKQSASWLTGLRAADNAGFTNLGIWFCCIYFVGIAILLLDKQRIGIIVISVLMLINSFAAVLTCEKYHIRDYANSVMCKDFYNRHRNEQIAVFCTDASDYSILFNMKLFYQVGDILDGISIHSIEDLEKPLWFAGDEYKYIFPVTSESVDQKVYTENSDLYEGSLEQNNVFLNWNSGRFTECNSDATVLLMEGGQVQISCEGDNNTLFICGTYILPRKIVGERITVTVDASGLEEDVIYIYDLGNLTVNKVRL